MPTSQPEQVSEKLSFDSSQSHTPRYSSDDDELSPWPRLNESSSLIKTTTPSSTTTTFSSSSSPNHHYSSPPPTTTHYQKILQLQLAKENDLRSRSNSALSTFSDSTLLPYYPHITPQNPTFSARIKHLLLKLSHEIVKLSRSKLFLPVVIVYTLLLLLFYTHPSILPPSNDTFPLSEYSQDRGIRRIASLGSNYAFSWADWKNISDQYLPAQGSPTKFATSHGEDIPFVLPLVGSAGTAEDMRWLAHMYLAFHAPAPAKILFLDPPSQFDIPESVMERAEIIPAVPDLGPILADTSVAPEKRSLEEESASSSSSSSASASSSASTSHFPPLPKLNNNNNNTSNIPIGANTIFQTSLKYASKMIPHFDRFGGAVWPRLKSSTLVLTPKSQCKSLPPRRMILPPTPPVTTTNQPSSLISKLKSRLIKKKKTKDFTQTCLPTEDEYTRRVNNEIHQESLLPPIYDELKSPHRHSPANLAQALTVTAQRVLLADPNTKENFYYNATSHISTDPNQTLEQMVHGQRIASTLAVIDKTPKFFHEAVVRRGSMVYYRHMDWRFFNHEMRGDENTQAMHRLFRAWSRFAEQEGVLFWLAHGTLLGWYWNGLSMPFDIDMDLQMPVRELDRIARKYNNTLIVETPAHHGDSSGRYLLEVAPSYIERESGNRNNLIDARFIDTATGVYIDLTGVARHPSQPDGWFACKNNHFYKISDLYPLRRTLFQGAPAYVPSSYEHILQEEYQNWSKPEFEDHAFDADLQLWVPLAACRDKIADTVPGAPSRSWADAEDGLERFCGSATLQRLWQKSHRLTDMHRREMALERAVRELRVIGDSERARLARFAVRQSGVYE